MLQKCLSLLVVKTDVHFLDEVRELRFIEHAILVLVHTLKQLLEALQKLLVLHKLVVEHTKH